MTKEEIKKEIENQNVIMEFSDGNKIKGFIRYILNNGIVISSPNPKVFYIIPSERIKSIKLMKGDNIC